MMFPAHLGRSLDTALRFIVILTVILGLAYPVAMWGVGRAFADKTDGSFIKDSTGQVVGSRLIGQPFDQPEFFHSRPSAGTYDAMDSGATNLAQGDPDLLADVAARRAAIMEEEGITDPALIPDDAVTASASGLDPHISQDYAMLQVPRVAKNNGMSEEEVTQLVQDNKEGRGINVLTLNLALTQLRGAQ